jgi:hypothetical protein
MNWKQFSTFNHWCLTIDNFHYYDVEFFPQSYWNGWVVRYKTNKPSSIGKFISKNLKARATNSIQANSDGLLFATKEEAMAVAERHYKLLLLQ